MANHGILAFAGGPTFDRKLSLDIGRIHYNSHHYLGTPTDRIADAYREERTAELVAGGICWFIGAGGIHVGGGVVGCWGAIGCVGSVASRGSSWVTSLS